MNHEEKNNHTSHMWMMVFACGGAFLLILVLPLFGVSKNWSTGIAIVVMVGLHLLMMRGHSGYSHSEHNQRKGGAR
ncbi:MAG: hypothetical protein Q7S74_04200 [Nanoarchaeota archaeon]|nr:hypothetical protein [Nanoarchaeota archaeon]